MAGSSATNKLDDDGDGVNDANDAFPTDPSETADTDDDGALSLEEFSAIGAIARLAERRPDAVEKIFNRLDEDEDGGGTHFRTAATFHRRVQFFNGWLKIPTRFGSSEERRMNVPARKHKDSVYTSGSEEANRLIYVYEPSNTEVNYPSHRIHG